MNENLVTELLNNGGLLIGSRALGVETYHSDYDIAISLQDVEQVSELRSYLDEIYTQTTNSVFSIRNYFNLRHPLGNEWVLRLPSIDILIFDNPDTIVSLGKAIELVKQVPSLFLKDKYTRVSLFETALAHYKWTLANASISSCDGIDEIPF